MKIWSISKKILSYFLNNKTIHDITQEDCEKLKEQNIDLEAECVALMAEYYVYRIKEIDEREKEEKRT